MAANVAQGGGLCPLRLQPFQADRLSRQESHSHRQPATGQFISLTKCRSKECWLSSVGPMSPRSNRANASRQSTHDNPHRPLRKLFCPEREGKGRGRERSFQCRASSNSDGGDGGAQKAPAASSVLSFLCPLLKLLSGGDAAAPRNRFLEVASSGFSSLARQPWGSQVRTGVVAAREAQPAKRLQVYEFEACPFCRRVRETLTELDLEAEIYPCPKDSLRHRAAVRAKGGKEMFPYLVDPNTGEALYESSDIVKYLFRVYGGGAEPTRGLLESTLVTGWVPTLLRAGRGMTRYPKAPAEAPEQMLELYSYENNQFARLVREALCELELPYILHNTGKGSRGRAALLSLKGNTQVPYLVDPNTGASVGDSEEIVKYLFKTYGRASAPAPVGT